MRAETIVAEAGGCQWHRGGHEPGGRAHRTSRGRRGREWNATSTRAPTTLPAEMPLAESLERWQYTTSRFPPVASRLAAGGDYHTDMLARRAATRLLLLSLLPCLAGG